MSNVRLDDALIVNKSANVLALPDGCLIVGSGERICQFEKHDSEIARTILRLADGVTSIRSICDALAGMCDGPTALKQITALLGCAVCVAPSNSAGQAEESRNNSDKAKLLVVGNGEFAAWIAGQLNTLGAVWELECGPANEDAKFPGPIGEDELGERIHSADIVVSALEGVSYSFIHRVSAATARAGKSCVPILLGYEAISIGPTLIAGRGLCPIMAAASALQRLRSGAPSIEMDHLIQFLDSCKTQCMSDGHWPEKSLAATAKSLRREVLGLLSPDSAPELLSQVLRVSPRGAVSRHAVLGLPECLVCAPQRKEIGLEIEPVRAKKLRAQVDSGFVVEASERRARLPQDGICRSIGIIGGGTAGYLAALAIRKIHPEMEVRLIESSSVPIIGVGEATTPLMPNFLHGLLDFEIGELFREVKPTFKLGIKFEWGAPGDSFFNYPFGPSSLLEPYTYEQSLLNFSLYSMLMSAQALPLIQTGSGEYQSFLKPYSAYHLDNVRFVRFLTNKAKKFGIEPIDALVTHADTRLGSDGLPEIAAIHFDDGRQLECDLYVDCTGFRSLLLEKTLQSKFISYDKSLITDTAVVADVPHNGRLKPYTLAETMNAGWCWNIPQTEADHRGYVFSSAFCSQEEAIAEMRRKNPHMGEHRMVKFRSGRHEEFWRGNVVALGNAYAFVEPLESTSLHMIIAQIRLLLDAMPIRKTERGVQRFLNKRLAEHWDFIRWFLSLHYRFNRKLDTSFWRHCQEHTDVSAYGELLSYFQERGPLSHHPSGPGFFKTPDPVWGPSGIDIILLGQKVPSKLPLPIGSEAIWKERLKAREAIVAMCLKQEHALEVLENNPALLAQFGNEAKHLRAEYVSNPN